jgi:restriction endonuclease S subunit
MSNIPINIPSLEDQEKIVYEYQSIEKIETILNDLLKAIVI